MYSNNYSRDSGVATRILFAFMILLLASLAPQTRGADAAAGFTVQPDKCIALHQGQVCYQDLKFSWRTPAGAEYCLYEVSQTTAVICWTGNELASHTMEFASASSTVYEIRVRNSNTVISAVTVEVAWVYRANRKSFTRWRLF